MSSRNSNSPEFGSGCGPGLKAIRSRATVLRADLYIMRCLPGVVSVYFPLPRIGRVLPDPGISPNHRGGAAIDPGKIKTHCMSTASRAHGRPAVNVPELLCLWAVGEQTQGGPPFVHCGGGRRARAPSDIASIAHQSPSRVPPPACWPSALRMVVRQSMCQNFFACGPWANRRKEVLSSCIVEEGAEQERPPDRKSVV